MFLPREDQFSGSLIGQCLGDALGFPVEGCAPDVCRSYVEEVLRKGRVEGRGPFPFGQYTDDSQLARELLVSYSECKGFNAEDYAERIADIFKENRIVGRGRATEEAAMRLIEGAAWEEAGAPPPSAGNGSAMRAGPVGLIFFDDPEALVRAACDQGRITHRDKRCSAGAAAMAGAVALALRPGPIDTEKFLSLLSDWVYPIEGSFAGEVERLSEWIEMPPEQAVGFISRAGLEPGFTDLWQGQGISPFVVGSVLWSLYAFLRTPEDYFETILTAIAVGGDVDTTASMAGAVSGAHLGLGAIPINLARQITDQGSWGFVELKELAESCYELKVRYII